MVKCSFCKLDVEKGAGMAVVSAIGKIQQFCSSKCERNALKLKRNPRKVKWIRKKKKSKITLEVELSILALRNTFEWGCERIKKGLYSLPKFMRDTLSKINVKLVQGVFRPRSHYASSSPSPGYPSDRTNRPCVRHTRSCSGAQSQGIASPDGRCT